jgi:hypothetical protein
MSRQKKAPVVAGETVIKSNKLLTPIMHFIATFCNNFVWGAE